MTSLNLLSLPIFLFGAVVGSFLNVCIIRIPKGDSIVHPPSHCPDCKNPIRFYDNIPLVSYLLLEVAVTLAECGSPRAISSWSC